MHRGFPLPNNNLKSANLAKLGQINYVNSLPITLPIEKGLISVKAEIHSGTPQELNYRYANGSLDLGAMSTFFYLKNGNLSLIPQLSIASKGPVGSVLFFCKRPLHSIKRLRVAATSASATSIMLLALMLREEFQMEADFDYTGAPDLLAPDVESALVIGDQALRVDGQWSKLSERIDLGEWWTSRFHSPMVFAVWAARSPWQALNSRASAEIAQNLRNALEIGLGEAFPQVITEAKSRTGLTASRLERYFREELDYCFTDSHMAGLNRYKSLCEKYELLDGCLAGAQKSWSPVA
jgi:chorismate dehydratase